MSLEIVTPALPDRFAETSVSAQIEDAVEFAVMTGCAVGVRGKPGIGKSSTIGKLLACRGRSVAAFEIPAGMGSQRNLVKWVCTAFEVPGWDGQHIGAILSRIRDPRFEGECLIVDEIQNADAAGIRMLLSLNEHAGMPVVMVGNKDALTRQGAKEAAWEQITDRVTRTVELEASLVDDTVAVAKTWGATDSAVLKVILAYAEAVACGRSRNFCGLLTLYLNDMT